LIFFHLYFVGKVGAILASIPLALAASLLCFMWALIVALGLSTLQYSQTASFRNITIVGVSLFLGLSIPAYFQQYQSEASSILPSYFVPYAAASNGPVHTGSKQVSPSCTPKNKKSDREREREDFL
jgi:nucleobase transporter 1/2